MSVFVNELSSVTPGGMELLRKFFRGYDYRGANYTFIANYIWRDSYCLSWEIIDGYLCMAGSICREDDEEGDFTFMAMPLIMSAEDAKSVDEFYRSEYEPESLRRVILECRDRFENKGKSFVFTSIPGHMLDILREAFPGEGEIEFDHGRDYDEYVYLKEKLIDLSGRALHKKKNHLNYFLRNFEYEVKEIREVDREDILALAAEIRDYKAQDEDETEDIENEYEAIEQMLNILFTPVSETGELRPCGSGPDDCPIHGVGIYINGKLEAFAMGEVITDTYAAEHFEKANDSFRGLYQLVCREYCKQLPESVIYVNREEDMGLPGLRQAKEALKPEYMEERYAAKILI